LDTDKQNSACKHPKVKHTQPKAYASEGEAHPAEGIFVREEELFAFVLIFLLLMRHVTSDVCPHKGEARKGFIDITNEK
jgi:hypothetical protein